MTGEVGVSAITVWELTRKSALGKLPLLPRVAGSFAGCLADRGFEVLPLTAADAERADALPPLHNDPMDRMLIAQALNAGLIVVTSDRQFPGYGVRTVW